jgi:hypothetical protein
MNERQKHFHIKVRSEYKWHSNSASASFPQGHSSGWHEAPIQYDKVFTLTPDAFYLKKVFVAAPVCCLSFLLLESLRSRCSLCSCHRHRVRGVRPRSAPRKSRLAAGRTDVLSGCRTSTTCWCLLGGTHVTCGRVAFFFAKRAAMLERRSTSGCGTPTSFRSCPELVCNARNRSRQALTDEQFRRGSRSPSPPRSGSTSPSSAISWPSGPTRGVCPHIAQ